MDDMKKTINYIAFASASFRQKKDKKPSAGFRDCSPVPFSKFYDTILHIIMSKINDAAHLKNMLVKLESSPQVRLKINKYLSCHHPGFIISSTSPPKEPRLPSKQE